MQVSLQALKAFESAARRGSFKLAAEELALTPTAISHHVSNLESRLNVNLFHRQGRRVTLTGAGIRLAKAASEGFQKIDGALEELQSAGNVVRVTTTSSLAALVLIPAQQEFEHANPDISLEISTGESVANEPYVIPLRFGLVSGAADSDVICAESFNAFGALGKTTRPAANKPVNLFTTAWKNMSLPPPPLSAWLEANGLDRSNIRVRQFDQELFGIQEAMAGKGLVFCSTTLTKRLVKTKLLQRCQTRSVESDFCYYVPRRDSFETRSAVRFLEWIEHVLSRQTTGSANRNA